jgi:hypothetical protein
VHCGGESAGGDGYFIKPTLFTDVNANMKIVKEEIFGPVGAVIKFEDEQGIRILSWLFLLSSPFFITKTLSRRPTTRYMVLLHMFSARISLGLSSRHTNSRQVPYG